MSSSLTHAIATGLAILIGGGGFIVLALALFRDRPRGRPRCPKCWYDMTGVNSLICPECGRDARRPRRLLKTRRRWFRAALGMLLMLLGAAAAIGEPIRQHGVIKGTPTWMYIVALPWIDDPKAIREVGSRGERLELRQWERTLLARRCVGQLSAADPPDRTGELLSTLSRMASQAVVAPGPFATNSGLSSKEREAATKIFVRLLDHPEPLVVRQALDCISVFAPEANAAIPALLARFDLTRRDLSIECQAALARLEVASHDDFLDTFHPSLFGPEVFQHWTTPELVQFRQQLAAVGADTDKAINVFRENLATPRVYVQAISVWALGALARHDPAVQEEVFRLADHPHHFVRREIVWFASKLPLTERTTAIIRNGLRDHYFVSEALWAVTSMGPRANVFLPEIAPRLDNLAKHPLEPTVCAYISLGGDRRVSGDAIYGRLLNVDLTKAHHSDLFLHLAEYGVASREMFSWLEARMRGATASYDAALAAFAYGRLGGDSETATKVLIESLRADTSGRNESYQFPRRLARAGQAHIPSLMALLDDADPQMQFAAVVFLGSAGESARPALPKLRTMQNHPVARIATEAARAEKHIRWAIANPDKARQRMTPFLNQRQAYP